MTDRRGVTPSTRRYSRGREVYRTPRRTFFRMSQTLGTPAMNVGRNSWIAPGGHGHSGFGLSSFRQVSRTAPVDVSVLGSA